MHAMQSRTPRAEQCWMLPGHGRPRWSAAQSSGIRILNLTSGILSHTTGVLCLEGRRCRGARAVASRSRVSCSQAWPPANKRMLLQCLVQPLQAGSCAGRDVRLFLPTGAAMLCCRTVCNPLPLQRPLRGTPGRDAAPALGGVGRLGAPRPHGEASLEGPAAGGVGA